MSGLKYKFKYFLSITFGLLFITSSVYALQVLTAPQGGTNIGSVTVGDIGSCLKVLSNSPFSWIVGTCGSGSGGGNVATSTTETAGFLPYWTSTGATPATLGKVATTTLSAGSGITITGGPAIVIGSSPMTINNVGGGASGTGTVATSTVEVSGQVPFFTSNAAVPALIGGNTNFTFDSTNGRLSILSASTTRLSIFNELKVGGNATTSINSTGDLLVSGSTTLQKFTGTNATTTNLFSTTASSTNLFTSIFKGAGLNADCLTTNALTYTFSTGQFSCTAVPQGTVTSVSVASANGLAGSSSGGATPQLTLSTTINSAVLKGNGTAISGAVNGTDYTLITALTCSAGNHFSAVTAAGVFTCSADTGSGGSGNNMWATSTSAYLGIIPNGGTNVNIGAGTSTPVWPITAASTSGAQLALVGSSNSSIWTFRNLNSALTLGTSSPTTFAVSPTTAFYIDANGMVGIGTNNPTGVNANGHFVVAGNSSQDIIASTTDDTTLSDAILQAYSSGSRVFMGSHGANQVTSRYGITLGGWGEISEFNSTFGSANGLVIGTNPSIPLVFGTANVERARFLNNGSFGIGTTTPNWLLQLSTTSAPQLVLSDNSSKTNNHWTFRNANGEFAIATASPTSLATSTKSALIITANGGLAIPALTSCDTIDTDTSGNLACGTDATGGSSGGGNSKFATSTGSFLGITPNGGIGVNIGIGTTTPYAGITVSSTTALQQVFTDTTATSNQWFNGTRGGSFFIGTSSPTTYATSTKSALTLTSSGQIIIPFMTSCDTIDTDATGALSCGTDANSGAAGASQTSTSTSSGFPNAIFVNGSNNTMFGIGTTTPAGGMLTVSSSTGPQIALSDAGKTNPQWFLRNVGANLFIGTTSPTTFATSTNSILSITNTGKINFGDNGDLIYDQNTSSTTIPNLIGGNLVSDNNPGVFSAYDFPLDTSCAKNTLQQGGFGFPSYSATSTVYIGGLCNGFGIVDMFVGIGTSSPNFKLEIASASATPQLALALSGTTAANKVTFRSGAGGELMISTSTNNTSATSSKAIIETDLNAQIYFPAYGTCNGTTNALGTTAGLVTCDSLVSDERLKKDFHSLTNAEEIINKLNPLTFYWKDLTNHNTSDRREQVGFKAQDVQKVIPSAIGNSPDGYLTLDKTSIIPYLVKNVQDLNKKVGLTRSVEENWQWLAILILFLSLIYQQLKINKLCKQPKQ